MVVTYEISARLERRAFRRLSWRTWGGIHIAAIVAGVTGVLITANGLDLWIGGFFLGVSLAYGAMWLALSLDARRAFLRLPTHRVTLELDESALRHSGDHVTSSYSWKFFASVWRYKDMWFLVNRVSRRAIGIPGAALTPELKAMIERKVKEGGGKIL